MNLKSFLEYLKLFHSAGFQFHFSLKLLIIKNFNSREYYARLRFFNTVISLKNGRHAT